MILAFLFFNLWFTSQPDGGHFGSCQIGGPIFGAFGRIWTKISL